jgi:hypothetical protein
VQRHISQHDADQPVEYVWHPAIEAILWAIRWIVLAVSTGIVWEFVVNTSLRADRVLARGSAVALALLLLTIVVFLIDFFGSIAQYAWDNFPPRIARTFFAVASIVFLAVSTPYVWLVFWLLKRAWPHILSWFGDIRLHPIIGSLASDLKTWVVLVGISAALLWYAYFTWHRDPFYSYRHAVEVLGLQKCIAGMCLMAYLRTLVPRRDFFTHAPVVSWMLAFAVVILVYEAIPIGVFAVAIPILVVSIMIPIWAGFLAPPLWIFLGKSEFDAFRIFYELRAKWRRHGLTLLDRTNAGGRQFYDAWRWSFRIASAPYDPGIARIWSLRTRPRLWHTAVRLLAAFVPVIVVDWRQPSEIVQSEVQWLERRNFLNKVYMVVSSERAIAAEQSTDAAKLVDEDTLIASQWDEGGSLVFTKA